MLDSVETEHFYIQYNEAALEASLTIEDYKASLETAWDTEVDTFGWKAPPRYTPNPAPDGLYHVRIEALAPVLYGFVSSQGTHAGPVGDNPQTPWNDVDADASCMGLNQDYSAFPGTPRAALDATTAHEFNHSLQFGYGALNGANAPELNFSEGGATWMEDEVQDASNDNYNYLYPDFESSMGEHGGNEYSYWLTFRGMTERYGTNAPGAGEDVMQQFWELTSQNQANMLTAIQGGLAVKGISLAAAYHDYAIAAKFVRPCAGASALPLCFEEGADYQAAVRGKPAATGTVATIGSAYSGSVEDNYALNWVGLPAAGSYDVVVKNTSTGGKLRVTLACDTGAAVAITPVEVTLGPGVETKVPGFNPGAAGCQEVVAAITNESQTSDNPDSSTARTYTVTTAAAPPITTPAVPVAGAGSPSGSRPGTVPAAAVAPPVTNPRAIASRLVFRKVIGRRNGSVLIRVRVSGAGTVRATARARVRASLLSRLKRFTVARRTIRPTRAGIVTLHLKAGRKARRVIRRRKGSLWARTTLVFTPAAGAVRTRTKKVAFRLKP